MRNKIGVMANLLFCPLINRRNLYWALFLLSLATIISLLIPVTAMRAIDYLKNKDALDPVTGLVLILTWLAAIIVVSVMEYFQKVLFRKYGNSILIAVNRAILDNQFTRDSRFFLRQNAKEMAAALKQDMDDLFPILSGMPFWLLKSIIVLFISLIIMIWINPFLSLALSVLVIPFAISFTLWKSSLSRKYYRYRLGTEKYLASLVEIFQSISLIKTANIYAIEAERSLGKYSEFIQARFKYFLVMAGRQSFAGIITSIAPIYLAFLALFFIYYNRATIGEIFAFWGLFSLMLGSLSNISGYYVTFLQSFLVIETVKNNMKINSPQVLGARQIDRIQNISCTPLHYRYGEQPTETFQFPAMVLSKGEWTEIRGASGCGKSTWVRLMLGLLSPMKGSVRVNGIRIGEIDTSDFFARIGYVEQSGYIYTRTLQENIILGRNFDPVRWRKVLVQTRLENINDRLNPPGDDILGENGFRLSGGERQKILIARALYHQPQWLFLDEPFTSLDAENQAEIEEIIMDLKPQLTVVIITHQEYYKLKIDRIVSPRESTLFQAIKTSGKRTERTHPHRAAH